MARQKEEYFVPTLCQTCTNACKKEIAVFLKEGFDTGRSTMLCAKFKKEKQSRKTEDSKGKKKTK